MTISFIVGCCVRRTKDSFGGGSSPKLAHKLAVIADIIVGLALLAIGLLGLFGVIPMAPTVSYSLISAGSAYAGIFILSVLENCKESCRRKSEYTYL